VSLLLSFCLILSLVPLSLSAEGPPTPLGSIEAGEVDFNDPGDTVQPMNYDDGNLYVSPAADYVKVGSTTTVYIECYDAYLEEVSSSNTDVATINSNGVISGISPGVATITIEAYDYTNSDYHGYSFDVTVFEDVGLQSGETYFVQSHVSAHYLISQPSSGTMAAAVAPLTEEEKSYGYVNDSWQLVQHSDGKYSFCYGTKALTLSGVNVTYADYTGSYYQKFTVYRVNVGSHRGGYVIRYGNFYMGISSSNELKLLPFIPGSSTTGSGHYWSFINATAGEANIVGFDYTRPVTQKDPDGRFNSTTELGCFVFAYSNLGYSADDTVNPSSEKVQTLLKSSSAFVYTGHGAPGKLLLYTTNDDITDIIVAHPDVVSSTRPAISDFAANSMHRAELVMYLACNTGVSATSGHNLLIESYKKGAKLIIGTYRTTNTLDSDAFLREFELALGLGLTIKYCLDYASMRVGGQALLTLETVSQINDTNEFPLIYYGDGNQVVGLH
ncbi:MAG: hypothetical protein IIX85_00450, partial [Clostridia bacterium]|nr:hypothetical protein [Clostridia bacterium]MBQ1965567.1 hypothetical protein [Clostridia bacterium]